MSTHAPLLFGKYKLLELVARGGMAEVFKAKSFGVDGFEKLVVIKRILPDLAQNQTFVDMCINEAKLSVALSHANIVQVFDLGREEDTYFIVMEYVNGMDFAEVLRRCRRGNVRAPMEICVYIAGETARALDYAHRRRDAQMRPLNLVHRDVSPQNILLSFEGEVKVTDFGIAKARTTIDDGGAVKGKYAYMAPEQARGLDVDARADIYALGVLLYEALTGKNPFHEPTPYQTLRRVRAGEKQPIKAVWPEVPDELARIVETATATEPAHRYATAAKFYEDLGGFLYTTGKRVAPHDLAEWMSELRGAAPREDESSRVRDALEDIEPSSIKTPVEVPAAASPASRPGPSTSAGFARPHLERRDVTLLCVEMAQHVPALDQLMTIAKRYGAVEIDRSDHHVLFIFGAHDPDGRDTETALRCAVKLLSAAQRSMPEVDTGIGVHAARLHVNAQGQPERDQWFTAAVALVRDLARAAGSKILASEPVGRVVGDLFHHEPLRHRSAELERVAGTPIHVLGERGVHEGARRRFVGRQEPFRRVGEILAWSSKAGSRALVVIGDAGAGKTRFLDEIHYRLRRMNHPVNWHTVTCLPNAREAPLSALQSMLRVILGIDDADSDAIARDKAQRLRELGLAHEEIRGISVLLGTGGSATAAGTTMQPLRTAVIKIAKRLAQDQLTVLVWDGAECIDDESQAAIDELVRTSGRARVVVMISCRPGFSYPWKDARNVEEITLGPLSDEETKLFVTQRLAVAKGSSIPTPLLEDLWAKGSGNPLFVEEYLRSLSESGGIEIRDGEVIYRREVAEVGVPKTLRGLVASEILRLTVPQRTVVQLASVIGNRFHQDLLAEVGGFGIGTLQQVLRGLVERGNIRPVTTDEFVFAHDLRREVIYEGLPLSVRRQMHATVAAALERMNPDRLDELADRLAHHFRESNDRPKAIEYLARAARRQLSEAAYGAATASLSRAIELVLASPNADPELVMDLYIQLGTAALRGRQDRIGIEKLQLALTYADDLGDSRWLIKILVLLGRLLSLGTRIVEAVTHFERARSLAESTGERGFLSEIVTAIGETYTRNGEFKRAHQYLEEAARLANQRGDRRDTAHALLSLARCEGTSGERDRALATLDRANDIALEFDEPALTLDVEKCTSLIHFHTRDFKNAAEYSERSLEIAREFGFTYEVCVNAHNCGDAWLRLGDFKRAFTLFTMSLKTATDSGFEKLIHLNNVFLAFIDAMALGDNEGRAKVEAALHYAETQRYTWDILHIKYLLGALAKQQGDLEKARRLLREALALANETDNRLYAEDCESLLRDVGSIPPQIDPPTAH